MAPRVRGEWLLLALTACSGGIDSTSGETGGRSGFGGTGGEVGPSTGGDHGGGASSAGGTGGLGGAEETTTGGSALGGEGGTGGVESLGGLGSGGVATGGEPTGGAESGGSGGGGQPTGATGGQLSLGGAPGGTAGSAGSGGAAGVEATGGRAATGGWVGTLFGTVGSTESSPEGDLDRAKVLRDGEQYVIQNNNYGDPLNTDLILEYVDNSFTVVEGYGVSSRAGEPVSFPSLYIGSNGDTRGGVFSTADTDRLPRQVSAIASIETSLAWGGTTESFATNCELWLAHAPPITTYLDAIDGMMRLWLHAPSDTSPPGVDEGDAVIAGYTWDVWVGTWNGPAGYGPVPLVTFVARSDIAQVSLDLTEFLHAADEYGILPSFYLTDVFFGFEIFAGGAGGELGVHEFTCRVD